MKNETKTSDIRATLAAREARNNATHDVHAVTAAIVAGTGQHEALSRAIESRNASVTAAATLAKIPAPRRGLAAQHVKIGEEIGYAAARTGGDYSGSTSYAARWGIAAEASTSTGYGDKYSRSCKYSKTDALHLVVIDPAGIPALVEAQAMRAASASEGLPLIALYPDHSAVWVRPGKGKAIVSERGWIAFESGHCFHSTRSLADAQSKLARKIDAIRREAAKARENRKAQRRAGLIARLCKGAVATIADAQALGYCSPGIASFQSRHGIGDSATLPELLKTGDPSAVRLALAVARKVSR